MKTSGGTVGVGSATTRSVVHSSILVIVADFFLAKALQVFFGVS
jgi:ABC-type transporter Mla maintaining outer membrane lipid asymmetry permease subunit MlaE